MTGTARTAGIMRMLEGVVVAQLSACRGCRHASYSGAFPAMPAEPTTVPALLTPNASTHGFSDPQPEPGTGILHKAVPMSAKPCSALKLPAVTV
jgi:hypothetical protein